MSKLDRQAAREQIEEIEANGFKGHDSANLIHISQSCLAELDEQDALIASQAEEITKLELCLEPGKASAIVRAVFDIAEKKCGHNPFSARHGLATIDEYLDRQAGLIQNMREALEKAPHIDGCRSALVLCANCGEVKPMHDGTMRYCRGRDDAAQWEPKARECNCWKSAALAQVSASPKEEQPK